MAGKPKNSSETPVQANRAARRQPEPQRRMPVRTADIELGEPWEGWNLTVRVNPPMGPWSRQLGAILAFEDVDVSSTSTEMMTEALSVMDKMLDMIALVAVEWNFVDEHGEAIPCTRAGCDQLPSDLVKYAFNAVTEVVGKAPLVPANS